MPLARIVTRTPAQLAALSEYLRARGYTVEFVEPGTLRTAPAELEMDLEGCTAEEAISRGVQAAEAAQTHSVRRAIAYDITGRPVAFADEEGECPAKAGNPVAQAWNGLRDALRDLREDVQLSFGRLREWAQEGRRTVQEYRTHYQEEHRRAQAEKEHEREVQALAREAERSRRQEEEEARQRAAAERFRRQQDVAAQRAEADRAPREQEEAARRAELAAARERWRQQQEQVRREALAEREHRLLEEFRREARQDAVQERFQVEQNTAGQEVAPAEAALSEREVQRPHPRSFQRDGDWMKAAVAAIVLALLATLGYAAYANRQPAAPLSNRALVRSQNVSQPVPFGAAVVPPPQLMTSPPPPPQRTVPQSDVAPKPPATPKPSPRVRRVRPTRVADDTVAEDEVVVHHSATTSARSRTTTARSTPKHISDLEQ